MCDRTTLKSQRSRHGPAMPLASAPGRCRRPRTRCREFLNWSRSSSFQPGSAALEPGCCLSATSAWHVGEVWDFWARVVEERITDVDGGSETLPEARTSRCATQLLEWVTAAAHRASTRALDRRPARSARCGPGPGDRTSDVDWVRRRMAPGDGGAPLGCRPRRRSAATTSTRLVCVRRHRRVPDVLRQHRWRQLRWRGRRVARAARSHLPLHRHERGMVRRRSSTPTAIDFTREHTKGDAAIRGRGERSAALAVAARRPARSTSAATPHSRDRRASSHAAVAATAASDRRGDGPGPTCVSRRSGSSSASGG